MRLFRKVEILNLEELAIVQIDHEDSGDIREHNRKEYLECLAET